MPEEPQTSLIVNATDKTVHKKTKKGSSIAHEIAPGEGKCCSNWMRDENFDIDAYPMHHGDGQFGLNHPREIKLSPQKYFTQRAMNHDKRWQKDSSYLFVAQQYIERNALEKQIDISMTKGKLKKTGKSSEILQL